MNVQALKFEGVLAAAMLAAGLLPLPLAVFWVGQFVVGEFEGGGAADLLGNVWTELARGNLTAWVLVLAPYIVIQMIRVARAALRRS